jgi:hypothetical protein
MRNWLFGLPGRILCEQSPWWLLVCSWLCSLSVSHFSISMSLNFPCTAHASSPKACLIIARVSIALFPRLTHSLMLFLCQVRREIASGQIHNSK